MVWTIPCSIACIFLSVVLDGAKQEILWRKKGREKKE